MALFYSTSSFQERKYSIFQDTKHGINQLEWFIFSYVVWLLFAPATQPGTSHVVIFVFGLQLHHHNYPGKYCVKYHLGTFAFLIRKNKLKMVSTLLLIISPSDFYLLLKKFVIFVEYMFSIFQLTSKRCWKRHQILYWN